jgi:lia operon protein LiaG
LDEKPDSLSVDFKGGSGEGTVDLDGLSYEEKSEDEILGKIGSGKYMIKARTSSGDFELR